ncbi:hypothetical protein SAMN05661044_00143 [Olivibacter domesticus]|uniref:Uncharacterized protein n=1 Tax=Olivibacter domesticus TaxID=407022 RepID=A0A1H7GNM1_OLID1|nr:hypothetical protein SAMN05661044_00143 [Olivibacter domesticus]
MTIGNMVSNLTQKIMQCRRGSCSCQIQTIVRLVEQPNLQGISIERTIHILQYIEAQNRTNL